MGLGGKFSMDDLSAEPTTYMGNENPRLRRICGSKSRVISVLYSSIVPPLSLQVLRDVRGQVGFFTIIRLLMIHLPPKDCNITVLVKGKLVCFRLALIPSSDSHKIFANKI